MRDSYLHQRERFMHARDAGMWLSTRGPRIVRRFGLWLADVAQEELLLLKVRSW